MRIGIVAEGTDEEVRQHERMAARARRVVVAYDGSVASRRALDAAADLVGYGATLAVVGVPLNGVADLRAVLEDARERLLRRHISPLLAEPAGEPTEAITAAAETLGANLVVVGGASEAEPNARLGSLAARVLRVAPCDVLVVR